MALAQPAFVLHSSFLRLLRKGIAVINVWVQGKKDEVSHRSRTPAQGEPVPRSPRLAPVSHIHAKSSPCPVPQFPFSDEDDADCEAALHSVWQSR